MILHFFTCPFCANSIEKPTEFLYNKDNEPVKIWQKVRDFDEQTLCSILKICKDIQRIINFTYSTK